MLNDMNYEKVYNQIVERSKTRELTCYTEKHHIIPRCMGGLDISENLVKLTAREHFICHWLLCRIYPDNRKLAYAFRAMCILHNDQQTRYIPSSRAYQECKEYIRKMGVSDEIREKLRKQNLGKKRDPESVRKGIETRKLRYPKLKTGYIKKTDDPNYKRAKRSPEVIQLVAEKLKGLKRDDNFRQRLSEIHKGKIISPEHRNAVSKALKGRKQSPEHIEKCRLARLNKEQRKVTCPYCNKVGGNAMGRWHFDNCKHKTTYND